MRALLDINVIIALLDANHSLHHSARSWLAAHLMHGWASCPITENGVIRILSQPAYPNPQPHTLVVQRLQEAQQNADHAFWPDDISPTRHDAIQWKHVLGHRQLTDAYLLALAVRHNGRLVTFDQRISLSTVKGAEDRHLTVIQ